MSKRFRGPLIVLSASFQGWTLLEALERTADPALWKACAAAKLEWEKVRTPIPSGPSSFFHHSPQHIEALAQKFHDCDQVLHAHFRQLLVDGKLVAYGSRSGPSEAPTLIHPGGWGSLAWPKRQNSTVKERFGARTKIYNVRVFPVLHSVQAPLLLNGLGLSEVFLRYVIEDPEVVALGKVVIAHCGHQDVFEKGQAPGPYVAFDWALGLSAEDLAWEFVRPTVFWTNSDLPQASPEILKAAKALADRCQALQRLLVTGQIEAIGTHFQTGDASSIHRLQWQRNGTTVEVRNGDLCESVNHRPAVRWSGIILELPHHVDHLRPPAGGPLAHATASRVVLASNPEEATATKTTAGQDSILEAVRGLWPEGIPKGLQLQQRDHQIIKWQRKNQRTVVSSRSIRRYLSRDGHPR